MCHFSRSYCRRGFSTLQTKTWLFSILIIFKINKKTYLKERKEELLTFRFLNVVWAQLAWPEFMGHVLDVTNDVLWRKDYCPSTTHSMRNTRYWLKWMIAAEWIGSLWKGDWVTVLSNLQDCQFVWLRWRHEGPAKRKLHHAMSHDGEKEACVNVPAVCVWDWMRAPEWAWSEVGYSDSITD